MKRIFIELECSGLEDLTDDQVVDFLNLRLADLECEDLEIVHLIPPPVKGPSGSPRAETGHIENQTPKGQAL